jgi:ankyrin repeat protein
MNAPLLLVIGLLLAQATAPSSAGANRELLESAKLGDLVRVKQLIASGASVSASDRRGFTPLMWASVSGNVAVANQLLESGASADARSNDGLTALMLASANGFTEVTRALILRGADVNASRNGVKARQFAVERGHTDIAALLDEAEGLGSKLLRAAAEGNDTGVRQLLATDRDRASSSGPSSRPSRASTSSPSSPITDSRESHRAARRPSNRRR